ncbi:MAG TPA: hypothetical protein VK673_10870 [Chthoniobacterales bacterium]|nr:hypothetical protein [Chthoniobacterales bacterium]
MNGIASVTAASNTTPIVITASATLKIADGELKIDGVLGNDTANGAFYVKSMDRSNTSFELYADKALTKPVAGKGEYQSGGTIYSALKDDYAIVVGINRYPALNALHGPEADATAFFKWLVSPMGAMVAMSKARCILSSDYPNPDPSDEATWQPALDALKLAFWKYAKLAFENDKKTGSARVGRRLWVFLAGHGITPSKAPSPDLDDAALLAASASVERYGEHLTGFSWISWFKDAAAFDEIILFMDCCRDLKNNVPAIPCTLTPLLKDGRGDVRIFYAVATDLDSQSFEDKIGDEYHGFFSHALMQTLQNEALLDTQNRLTAPVVAQQLKKIVPQLRKDQVPRFIPNPPPEITLVKGYLALKPNLQVTFTPGLKGTVELFQGDNTLQSIDSHDVNDGPWSLRVDPFKIYKLAIPGVKSEFVEMNAAVKNVNF